MNIKVLAKPEPLGYAKPDEFNTLYLPLEKGGQEGFTLVYHRHFCDKIKQCCMKLKNKNESVLEPAPEETKNEYLKLVSYGKYSLFKDSFKNEYRISPSP